MIVYVTITCSSYENNDTSCQTIINNPTYSIHPIKGVIQSKCKWDQTSRFLLGCGLRQFNTVWIEVIQYGRL